MKRLFFAIVIGLMVAPSFVSASVSNFNLIINPGVIPPISGGGGSSSLPYNVSVIINNGAICTSTSQVTLQMYASNASAVLISNDQNFLGAVWQPFLESVAWNVQGDYGNKRVYVLVRNSAQQSSYVVFDDIEYSNQCVPVNYNPLIDSDGDGVINQYDGLEDFDADGTPNYLDIDSDGDGILDSVELMGDNDGDGIMNMLDVDSDNDGISDAQEKNGDVDEDGIPNYFDVDADNDGIADLLEGGGDVDGDGIPNNLDRDADNDGVPDDVEKNGDVNNDGVLDFLDPGTGSNYRYVIVYEHINYKGRYEIFSADDYYLKDNIIGNDQISSIKLVNLDFVYVYEHILLGGRVEKISSNVSDMRKLGIGNDVISSLSFQQRHLLLTLSSPLIVTYSKESSQGVRGVYNAFSTSNTTLYPYIKSLQLLTKGVLKLFSEINFKGEVKVVTGDVTNTSSLPISQIKSFQIDKEIQSGDLIRGESKNTVYYVGNDFKIHPFINQFIYQSWFPTFATVITITDTKMNQFLVGEAVWYRPGSLIKSVDSPRVYAVDRGNTILSISNEATAKKYFGDTWHQNIFTVTQEDINKKMIKDLSDENFNSLPVANIDQTL